MDYELEQQQPDEAQPEQQDPPAPDLTRKVLCTIIVVADYVSLARALAEAFAGPAGAGMWVCGLSADGSWPPTHYVSSGDIELGFALILQDADAIYERAQALGFQVDLETLQALVATSVVREGVDLHPAAAEVGLQVASQPEETL